jgi:hypothetical protein
MPADWEEGLICSIYKKGDPLECKNYRGITLANVGYKISSKVLFRKLEPVFKENVGKYQRGFIAGKSTSDKIFNLRQVMEKTSEYGIKTYYLFIDFKVVYDSINRQSLYLAMRDMGIPDKLIRLTELTMTNNCAMVKLRKMLCRQFDIKEGVRQGDPLACLLFNISLENLIRDAEVETRGTIFNKSVQIMAYTGDIVIAGRSLAVVKETFISMEKAAKEMGLTVNENKTKFMALNDPAYSNLTHNRIS